jgi:hypothetical protein
MPISRPAKRHGQAPQQRAAFWRKTGEGIGAVKLTTVNVKPLGPVAAREIGTFALTTKGAQPQQLSRGVAESRKRLGLATDIWNSDK